MGWLSAYLSQLHGGPTRPQSDWSKLSLELYVCGLMPASISRLLYLLGDPALGDDSKANRDIIDKRIRRAKKMRSRSG